MPRWYKRILLVGVILLGIATGVIFAFGDRMAAAIARRAVTRLTTIAAARGIELRDVRFERASIAGFGAIRCNELSGVAGFKRIGLPTSPRSSMVFSAAAALVDVGWPWSKQARIAIVEGHTEVLDASGSPTGERLTGVRAQVDIPFSWWSPGAAAVVIDAEARRVLQEGRTQLPLEFQAVASFSVARRAQKLTVRTEPADRGGARVTLDRTEIEQLSRDYTNPLTATEIDLVARHPHRAPALLRVCEQANRAARAQRHRDRSFPFDAYRHVYWSWLLTKEFGPEFSEEVTDAHEIGATYELGPAARRMDLQNNAVGRAYALAGVEEGELLERVLTDPHVMRKLPAAP